MPRCPRDDVSMKKAQGRARYKRHGSTCKDEQKCCVRTTVLASLTGEAFVARYDELTKLSAQLATSLRISQSLQSKRLNTKCNGIVAGKIERQAASNLSDAVQDNTTHPTQLPSTSQVCRSRELEVEHSAVQKCKNSVKEKRKGDGTMIVSANDKCRTNLVTNQVGHVNLSLILSVII